MKSIQGSLQENRSAGFSLIELMIAITLGLVVTAAVSYVFVSSKRNLNYSQGISRIQENARSSLIVLNTLVRQAGYLYNPILYSVPGQNDPTIVFVSPAYAVDAGLAASTLSGTFVGHNSSATNPGQYLQVSFNGDGIPPSGTNGTITNCVGTIINQNQISVNIFYVDQAAGETAPSLYCSTQTYTLSYPPTTPTAVANSLATQPLIYGVNNLTLNFGFAQSSTTAPREVNWYGDYTQLANGYRQLVASVVLTLQTQSTATAENTGVYACANSISSSSSMTNAAGTVTQKCGYLQRPFTQTIQFRNSFQ